MGVDCPEIPKFIMEFVFFFLFFFFLNVTWFFIRMCLFFTNNSFFVCFSFFCLFHKKISRTSDWKNKFASSKFSLQHSRAFTTSFKLKSKNISCLCFSSVCLSDSQLLKGLRIKNLNFIFLSSFPQYKWSKHHSSTEQ